MKDYRPLLRETVTAVVDTRSNYDRVTQRNSVAVIELSQTSENGTDFQPRSQLACALPPFLRSLPHWF